MEKKWEARGFLGPLVEDAGASIGCTTEDGSLLAIQRTPSVGQC